MAHGSRRGHQLCNRRRSRLVRHPRSRGKYTLYTLPEATSWNIIISKQTGQWGTVYDPAQDLARIKATPVALSQPVDQFTISLEKRDANTAVMKLEWENTSVPLEIKETSK